MPFALGSKGYTIIEATSAAQAHERFRENSQDLDLLIADIGLPDGSGVQVALALWLKRRGLRIIITSGYPPSMWNEQDATAFEKLPPDTAVHLKPFFPAKLIEVVDAMIGRPERVQTAEAP